MSYDAIQHLLCALPRLLHLLLRLWAVMTLAAASAMRAPRRARGLRATKRIAVVLLPLQRDLCGCRCRLAFFTCQICGLFRLQLTLFTFKARLQAQVGGFDFAMTKAGPPWP